MSTVKQWFERSAGEWISNRRYFYESSGKNQLVKSELKVELKPSENKEFAVELNWDSTGDVESAGTMLCEFDNEKNILYRNIGYMTSDPTYSEVTMIDDDTILFKTEYDGMTFREEIRLIGDNVRLRQTLGWKRNTVFLAGQYYEKRK
jgi:CpeS-like protein